MKLQALVLAAALSGTFCSSTAMAGTFERELVGTGATLSTHVGNDVSAGVFTDTFTFTGYPSAGIAGGALTSVPTNLSQLVFTGATLNGISLDVSTLFGVSTVTWNNVTVSGPLELVITGKVTNSSPDLPSLASYGGNFSITSAVPEPATYGMLAGGLGVLAFAARRRKA